MKIMFALAVLLGTSAPAFARDGVHLVCTGFMTSKPGPDNYGIAMQLDEGRAEDGSSRNERISSVWAGDLYQGTRLNKEDEFGKNGNIVLASKEDAKKIFYKGKYDFVQDSKKQKYKLKLNGQMNLDPSDTSGAFEAISTTLSCVDISN